MIFAALSDWAYGVLWLDLSGSNLFCLLCWDCFDENYPIIFKFTTLHPNIVHTLPIWDYMGIFLFCNLLLESEMQISFADMEHVTGKRVVYWYILPLICLTKDHKVSHPWLSGLAKILKHVHRVNSPIKLLIICNQRSYAWIFHNLFPQILNYFVLHHYLFCGFPHMLRVDIYDRSFRLMLYTLICIEHVWLTSSNSLFTGGNTSNRTWT